MAGIAGKAGRPQSTKDYYKILLRLPPELEGRIEHCHGLLQRQHGPKFTQTQALWSLLETGCSVVEGTLEDSETSVPTQNTISEISKISSSRISKISEISGDDVSVPGYGFPEDEDESPAPQPPTQPAIPLALEPAPTTAHPVDVPQAPEPPDAHIPHEAIKVATQYGVSVDIVKIAEARAQYDRMSEREFIQLLFDRGIYRHQSKDGSYAPIPHSTYRAWMKKAHEAGLL